MAESVMQAVVLSGVGGLDQLQVRYDVPRPTPTGAQALIQVAACGVNNTDINTRTGWYAEDSSEAAMGWRRSATGLGFPRIQGADVAGSVVAVGPDADRRLVGQQVIVDPWVSRAPEWQMLGSEVDGGFAQFCVVPAVNAYPVHSGWSAAELASIPCSWSTALNMIERANVVAGERVVVTGASGGVGTAAVQLLRARGAEVLAVAGASKAPALADMGALAIPRQGGDPAASVRQHVGDVDVVLDVVGGPDVGNWLGVLTRRGRYVVAGAIAGPVVPLDLRTVYLNDLTLAGVTTYGPDLFQRLVEIVESGSVSPVVSGVYSLRNIHRAQEDFMAKRHVGALVLLPDPV